MVASSHDRVVEVAWTSPMEAMPMAAAKEEDSDRAPDAAPCSCAETPLITVELSVGMASPIPAPRSAENTPSSTKVGSRSAMAVPSTAAAMRATPATTAHRTPMREAIRAAKNAITMKRMAGPTSRAPASPGEKSKASCRTRVCSYMDPVTDQEMTASSSRHTGMGVRAKVRHGMSCWGPRRSCTPNAPSRMMPIPSMMGVPEAFPDPPRRLSAPVTARTPPVSRARLKAGTRPSR